MKIIAIDRATLTTVEGLEEEVRNDIAKIIADYPLETDESIFLVVVDGERLTCTPRRAEDLSAVLYKKTTWGDAKTTYRLLVLKRGGVIMLNRSMQFTWGPSSGPLKEPDPEWLAELTRMHRDRLEQHTDKRNLRGFITVIVTLLLLAAFHYLG